MERLPAVAAAFLAGACLIVQASCDDESAGNGGSGGVSAGGSSVGGAGAGGGSVDDAGADAPRLDGAAAGQWTQLDPISFHFPSGYSGDFQLRFWCNFVWDPDGQRLLFYEGYGGSHDQSGGSIYANTLYGFTPGDATVRLIRLTANWQNPGYDEYVAGSGPAEPHPRHTYGGFTYVSQRQSVYLGFGACAHAPNCPGPTDLWRYEMAADTWHLIDAPLPDDQIGGYDTSFAHLPGSDTLWVFSPRRNASSWVNIYAFDMASETWSPAVDYGEDIHSLAHAVANPVDGDFLLWADGGDAGQLYRFNPNNSQLTAVASTPATLPGGGAMTFMTAEQRFFLYSASEDAIWLYDPAADSWEQLANPDDPHERIDRYLAYDQLNEVVVTMNVEGEFWVYAYAP